MRTIGLAAAAVAVLLVAAPAGAMNGLDIGGELMLGMGGDMSFEIQGQELENDLQVTAGFGLFAEYEIWKYIDIGGHANLTWWKIDGGAGDRSLFFDIAPYVKGKYRFLNEKLEIFGKFPFGFTLSHGNDKTDAGFHTGIVFGAGYYVWKGLLPFIEMGWTFHWIRGDALDFTFNQFALNLGMSWSF